MLELGLVAKIIAAAVIFGAISRGFSEVTHRLQASFKRFIAYAPLRPLLGGLTVIALVYVLGSRDYLGIGVTSPDPKAVTLLSAFQTEGAEPWSWAGKFLFTTVTLASGFKGGEVTPLFFIGATLGHALAVPLGAPVALCRPWPDQGLRRRHENSPRLHRARIGALRRTLFRVFCTRLFHRLLRERPRGNLSRSTPAVKTASLRPVRPLLNVTSRVV